MLINIYWFLKIKIILKEILNLRGRFCFEVLSLLITQIQQTGYVPGKFKKSSEILYKGIGYINSTALLQNVV